jgi:uncharacterized membrane protein
MMKLKPIILTALVMILIDYLYLTINKNYYFGIIEQIQGSRVNIKIAGVVICYIILVLGMNYFIISENKSILSAFLLGIMVYSVFNSTTYAMFNKWNEKVAIMDTLWGGILFATTTYIVRNFM